MTFNDILKSSFLEKATDFSIVDVSIALITSFILALFIYMIYKKTFTGVMYSSSFGVSIIAMTLITTLIILAITSNVILSLGMVGALSIVRFRTAVKEPMDIAYLFWSISIGIVVGAGLLPLAVVGTVFIGIILMIFSMKKSTDSPYIIILNCDDDMAEEQALEKIKNHTKKSIIKSKTVTKQGIELTMEIRLKEMTAKIVNQLLELNGVSNAVLVSYNGEYMS